MNKVREKFRAGGVAIGTFNFLDDPGVAEIAGLAGFDFILIDMEHSSRSLDRVENIVRAAHLRGIAALIRIGSSSSSERDAMRALDTGANGIVVPMIEDPEQVRRLRRATQFPPKGERGTCSVVRAAKYSSLRSAFGSYLAESNQDVLLIGLLETLAGIERAAEIAAAGLDVVIVGRGDLSARLGIASNAPEIVAAVSKVAASISKIQGTYFGMTAHSEEQAREWIGLGCRFLVYRDDVSTLFTSFNQAAQVLKV